MDYLKEYTDKYGWFVPCKGVKCKVQDVEYDDKYGYDVLIGNPSWDGMDPRFEFIWIGDPNANSRLTEADEETTTDDNSEGTEGTEGTQEAEGTEGTQEAEKPASAEETVAKLKGANYEQFAKILDSDGKSKAFFDYLKAHYKMGDDSIGTIKKCSATEGLITCGKLIPTQLNISLKKSFDFLKLPGWSENVINDPLTAFDTPTIVYAGKYIIDGHHRWSKVYALHGPSGQLNVINFPEVTGVSWEDMLKAVQLAIRANSADLDLSNKVDTPNMLDDKNGKLAAKLYIKVACDAVVNAMKEKGYGNTKEKQSHRVASNVVLMAKRGSVPGAQPREWMPQTDKIDKEGKVVVNTLQSDGIIDMTEHFSEIRRAYRPIFESARACKSTIEKKAVKELRDLTENYSVGNGVIRCNTALDAKIAKRTLSEKYNNVSCSKKSDGHYIINFK